MNRYAHFLAATLAALSLVGVAQAGVIWFDDFESPATIGPYDGTNYLSNWVEKWGHLPAIHVYQPTSADFDLPLASPAGGQQVLWISQNGNWAARSGGLIEPDRLYTLSAAVGDFNCDAVPFWRVQLWAGDADGPTVLLNEIAHNMAGANIPADRNWALNSVTFNSNGSSYVGQTLWARLYMDVGEYGSDPGQFDNVLLQSTSAPEPSTGVILLALMAILLPFARRKTRRQ
ncbi:MAG: hypothetical protein ABFC96_01095 [Thermoguttaceae bacterium]